MHTKGAPLLKLYIYSCIFVIKKNQARVVFIKKRQVHGQGFLQHVYVDMKGFRKIALS